jgi:hypothetical protein
VANARPGDAIEAALREVATLLEANEVIAAAGAVQRLGAACNAAASAGIDDITRTRLAPLVEHCTALAAKSNARLAAALARFGTSNRAYRAYNAD